MTDWEGPSRACRDRSSRADQQQRYSRTSFCVLRTRIMGNRQRYSSKANGLPLDARGAKRWYGLIQSRAAQRDLNVDSARSSRLGAAWSSPRTACTAPSAFLQPVTLSRRMRNPCDGYDYRAALSLTFNDLAYGDSHRALHGPFAPALLCSRPLANTAERAVEAAPEEAYPEHPPDPQT